MHQYSHNIEPRIVTKINLTLLHHSYPVRSDSSGDGSCESTAANNIRSSIIAGVRTTIENEVAPRLDALLRPRYLGMTSRYPATNCAELLQTNPNTPSGFYWIQTTDSGSTRVWCNMELACGPRNITGWARVGLLNLSDSAVDCPNVDRFRLQTSTNGVRYCERVIPGGGCEEHIFQTNGVNFNSVCGRVSGVQIGSADVFEGPNDINMPYVDGVSLTYGNPRQHIWTFVGYYSALFPRCPCSTGSTTTPFDFIGQDYFCESGTNTENFPGTMVFDQDLLWDGQMCTDTEVPCCNGAPWFYKSLGTTVSEDISFRLCSDQGGIDEEMGFTLVEIYVQ